MTTAVVAGDGVVVVAVVVTVTVVVDERPHPATTTASASPHTNVTTAARITSADLNTADPGSKVSTMRRLLLVGVLALAVAGTAAAVVPTTVLPRPSFPSAVNGPGTGSVHFQVVSSTRIDPAQLITAPKPRGLEVDGEDGNTQHYVSGPGFTFDFRNYAHPPRIAPGERDFVYEQVVWARLAPDGVLYVETAHQTYAKSSYGRNAYVSAIDPKGRKLLWRSPALVANADDFVLLNDTIVSGYGFTAEPDYLYAIDRATGKVTGRLLLPNAPQTIARHGSTLTVVTYDRRLTIRVTGA